MGGFAAAAAAVFLIDICIVVASSAAAVAAVVVAVARRAFVQHCARSGDCVDARIVVFCCCFFFPPRFQNLITRKNIIDIGSFATQTVSQTHVQDSVVSDRQLPRRFLCVVERCVVEAQLARAT